MRPYRMNRRQARCAALRSPRCTPVKTRARTDRDVAPLVVDENDRAAHARVPRLDDPRHRFERLEHRRPLRKRVSRSRRPAGRVPTALEPDNHDRAGVYSRAPVKRDPLAGVISVPRRRKAAALVDGLLQRTAILGVDPVKQRPLFEFLARQAETFEERRVDAQKLSARGESQDHRGSGMYTRHAHSSLTLDDCSGQRPASKFTRCRMRSSTYSKNGLKRTRRK